MIDMRFKFAQIDQTIFIKYLENKRRTTLLIYIDDIIITENDQKEKLILK